LPEEAWLKIAGNGTYFMVLRAGVGSQGFWENSFREREPKLTDEHGIARNEEKV